MAPIGRVQNAVLGHAGVRPARVDGNLLQDRPEVLDDVPVP